ncbi:putative RNA-directed DNA polymerase [Aphis craccivora]|uniref:Putative RNA-directed DNA polymerase n=1 Tax=Aphis craccivora TaxID=307492 RepID=A0A6G0VWY8_APHCR|nr:putative RNA-directed DNA polymerase [Aphis craccivora]
MYDFVNCDYNSIRSNLASLDWNGIFNINIFYENVFKIIYTYCPVKTIYLPKHPHWFSSSLKKVIRDKKNVHKTYKQSPNSYNYNKFSNLRSSCKAQNKIDYNIFIQKTQNSIGSSNPKFKRSTHSLSNSMYYNNNNISGGNDITNCFAQYFSSVLNMPSISESISDYYNTSIPSVDLNSCTLSLSDVYNELNEITYINMFYQFPY